MMRRQQQSRILADDLPKVAGIENWPHNGLRHSFSSYHLAQYGDGNKTAVQMGHRDQNVVHNHYKALVLADDAAKYWALVPSQKRSKKQQKVCATQTPEVISISKQTEAKGNSEEKLPAVQENATGLPPTPNHPL
jgi:hypothetical protein